MNTTNRSIPFPTRKAMPLGSGAVAGRLRASGRSGGAAGLLLRGPGSVLTVCAHTWARGPRVPGCRAAAREQPWSHSSLGHPRSLGAKLGEAAFPDGALGLPGGGGCTQRTRGGLARAGEGPQPVETGPACSLAEPPLPLPLPLVPLTLDLWPGRCRAGGNWNSGLPPPTPAAPNTL